MNHHARDLTLVEYRMFWLNTMNGDFFIQCEGVLFVRGEFVPVQNAWWQHDCMYLQNVWSGHVGSNPNEWKGEHCWCDACTLGREKGQSNMPEEGESLRTTALSPYGVISARLGRGE